MTANEHPAAALGFFTSLAPALGSALQDLLAHCRDGLLERAELPPLERLREHNPLLFDFALKRSVRWRGQVLSPRVFASASHFEGLVS